MLWCALGSATHAVYTVIVAIGDWFALMTDLATMLRDETRLESSALSASSGSCARTGRPGRPQPRLLTECGFCIFAGANAILDFVLRCLLGSSRKSEQTS